MPDIQRARRRGVAGPPLLAALVWLVGCNVPALPDGSSDEVTVRVFNGGLELVRLGFDRGTTGTITELTPPIAPNDALSLDLPLARTRSFDVFVRGAETGNQFLGPFPCDIDIFCDDPNETHIIWTGSQVLCTSTGLSVIELLNDSAGTAFLLVDDEQPQLPILPLLPGERRFVAAVRSGGQASPLIRVFVDDPLLGLRLVEFTRCRAELGCAPQVVRYDGQRIFCE